MKSIIKPFLLLFICFGIVAGYYFYSKQESAPPPATAQPAPEPTTPPEVTPEPVQQIPQKPEPIIPEPTPEMVAPERPDPMKWIANNWRGRILNISITKTQNVPVYADGQVVGEAKLPMDQPIPVQKLSNDSVTVEFLDHLHDVPFSSTDIEKRANIALDRALATSARKEASPTLKAKSTEKRDVMTALDLIVFGNSSSEREKNFKSDDSTIINGGLDQPARQIKASNTWKGGSMFFTLKVDPDEQNYMTVKFWGNDIVHNRLFIFIDGKQLGYNHLGDIDLLDLGAVAKTYPDRFSYTTCPLPKKLTRGKEELEIEIRAQGGIWAYGGTFEKYQHDMEKPSRGIYAAYTHTESFFQPSPNEKQGVAPEPKIRSKAGREVLDRLKDRINSRVRSTFSREEASQNELRFLAYCYHIKWSEAYKEKDAIKSLLRCGDMIYQEYLNDRDFVTHKDHSVGNQGWKGLGSLGEAIWLMHKEIKESDWKKIIHKNKTRREAWSEMMVYSRDWNMSNRRKYTNQSMIKDLYGIYLANKGLRYVDAPQALDESVTLEFLYESMGIKPWLGPIDENGRPTKPAGDNYYLLTQKALTKELGYVGAYGEVQDWAALIYEATRPYPGEMGDAKLLEQLSKINRARSYFRYPALDDEGYQAMRMEGVVGWRDFKYPGNVVYGQKPATNGSALQTAAATQDPYSVGYAQQLIEEGQFFPSVEYQLTLNGIKNEFGMLTIPDEYDIIRNLPDSPHRLPMSPGQPDFVFSDEEAGVIALKNEGEIFYASLYWRARYGINNLARIHHMTPEFARVATVMQATEFSRSSMTYERENWINYGFAGGGRQKYPEKWDSAHTGEKLPIAKIPSDIDFKAGNEDSNAGKGDFYTLHYGPYLIGMNCTTDETFELEIPTKLQGSQMVNLVNGETVTAFGKIPVKPRSTVVLFKR